VVPRPERIRFLERQHVRLLISFTEMLDRNLKIIREKGLVTVEFVEIFIRYFEILFIQVALVVMPDVDQHSLPSLIG
jgi:hypothetical protein